MVPSLHLMHGSVRAWLLRQPLNSPSELEWRYLSWCNILRSPVRTRCLHGRAARALAAVAEAAEGEAESRHGTVVGGATTKCVRDGLVRPRYPEEVRQHFLDAVCIPRR
jgi:hypothetical protein